MNAASPVSTRRTRMFAPIAKNFDIDQPEQDIFDFDLRIFEEDRAIVEIQKPENLPSIPASKSTSPLTAARWPTAGVCAHSD
jgi:hypothetical protein